MAVVAACFVAVPTSSQAVAICAACAAVRALETLIAIQIALHCFYWSVCANLTTTGPSGAQYGCTIQAVLNKSVAASLGPQPKAVQTFEGL